MPRQSNVIRFLVVSAAFLSLLSTFLIAPINSTSASAVAISTKTRVLVTEQKVAKSKLDSAKRDLKQKEALLKKAVVSQKKAKTALNKAKKKANALGIRTVKISTASKKIKSASKSLSAAQKAHAKAVDLVKKRTKARDLAKANVVQLDAAYAWLVDDISDLDCGVGTDVAHPNGAVEHVWECGIVYMHEDGDTTHVKTTENKLVEVRNIGLQTPELKKGNHPAQCGAKQAFENFRSLMPEEITVVQLRSISKSTNGWGGHNRPTRSVYKMNPATGLFDIDVQAEQLKAGWSLWWPTYAEWTHNAEYLDLVNAARAQKIGIWNSKLCGSDERKAPRMWVNTNAPTIGSDFEPIFGEYVTLNNATETDMDISGWSLRDQSLNFFWDAKKSTWKQDKNEFPEGTIIPAGGHVTFYMDNPKKYPLNKASEREYFKWAFGDGGALLANAYVNNARISGEGVMLLDSKGNIRRTFITPCGSSSEGFAECVPPKWFTKLATPTDEQIIPVPIALNRVANTTYNPVVKLVSGSIQYLDDSGTYVPLSTNGKFIDAGVSSEEIDGKYTANKVLGFSTSRSGELLKNSRVPIADKTGTKRTKVYTRVASGFNALPSVIGMTAKQATDALAGAGFKTVTSVVGPSAGEARGTVASLTVDSSAPKTRHALTSTIVLTVHP
jgi:endonuclease YncB( thermonuclease family)